MSRSRLLLDAAIIGVLGVTVLGSTIALSMDRSSDGPDPVERIRELIEERYVEDTDSEELEQGAIRGMLETLDDPYTVFVPPSDADDFRKDLTGEYVGIGAQITVRDQWLTIVTPLEDSPAYRAGIMPEDRVTAIDGASTFGKTADEAVDVLVGIAGDPVILTIEREAETFDVEIIRAPIKTRSVKGVHRDPDDPERWFYAIDPERKIAYVRITQFTPNVTGELITALRAADNELNGIAGLIIDVRNNPGGVLDDAIRIADIFIPSGTLLSTKGRAYPEQSVSAKRRGTVLGFPIAVLINEGSASASEILAGAIVDNDRGITVGMRTFGKGSVQSVLEVPEAGDGATLKITEQYYYLPSGRLIHRKPDSSVWGVDPSDGFAVPLTNEQELDIFFARQELELLQAEAADEDAEPTRWDDPDWIVEKLKDPQLAAAIEAVQINIDTGDWTPTGESRVAGEELVGEELAAAQAFRDRLLRQLVLLDDRIEDLQIAAAGLEPEPESDLWDDEIDLTDGSLTVFDKDGKAVASLRITGPGLEQWLIDAQVEPVATETESEAEPDEGGAE